MVPLESEQPEGLVLTVVNFRDIDGAAHCGGEFVVRKRVVARELLEPGAMDQVFCDVTVFRRPMPAVGPRFEYGGQQTAGGVTKLRGHPCGEELDLFESVDRGGSNLVGGTDHGAHRFLTAD